MASLGATPEQSVYVGDVYSVDFAGAEAVGMRPILIDVAGVYRDTPYPRVESLTELETLLDKNHWQSG
jgi:FMN phosphatase YigB (HAD superfamily)